MKTQPMVVANGTYGIQSGWHAFAKQSLYFGSYKRLWNYRPEAVRFMQFDTAGKTTNAFTTFFGTKDHAVLNVVTNGAIMK